MFDVVPNLSFFDRVTLGELYVLFGHLDELLIVLVKRLDFPSVRSSTSIKLGRK